VLALFLASCASEQPAATTEEATDVAVETGPQAPVTPEPEPTLPAEEPEPQLPSIGEIDVVEEPVLAPEGIFSGTTAALDALDSYRYTTLFTFVGEDDGEVESGSIELTGVIAGEGRIHLKWRDLGEDRLLEVIRIDDEAWMAENGEWSAVPTLVADAMSQAVLIYAPSVAWGGVFGGLEQTATYIGREMVNGIEALHYTSTYAQWGGNWGGELTNASGDVWIAEAGYPLKYSFTASGSDDEGGSGLVTWTMELSDINEILVIEPPAEFSGSVTPPDNTPPANQDSREAASVSLRDLEGTYSATANGITVSMTIYDADSETAYGVFSSTNVGATEFVALLIDRTLIVTFIDLSEMRFRVNSTTSLTDADSGMVLRRR